MQIRPNTEKAKILSALVMASGWLRRSDLKAIVQHPKGYWAILKAFQELRLGAEARRGQKPGIQAHACRQGRVEATVFAQPAGQEGLRDLDGARWEIWPVSAAYPHRDTARIRCYECHGPVVLMRTSQDGRNEAHFEHKPAHPGCSLVHKQRRLAVPVLAAGCAPASLDSSSPDYISEEAAEGMMGRVRSVEKERLILARVGQGYFRKKLAARWKTCSVNGCGPQSVLIASHIVAWRNCDTNKERLDVNNGLLLTPNLDKLFSCSIVGSCRSPRRAPCSSAAISVKRRKRMPSRWASCPPCVCATYHRASSATWTGTEQTANGLN